MVSGGVGSAAARRAGRRPPPAGPAGATRRPAGPRRAPAPGPAGRWRPARRPATAGPAGLPGSTISGAPSTQVPWPAKLAALHLRAEENGTAACRAHPSGGGKACPTAASVALRFWSSASAPSAASAGAWPSSRMRLSKAMVPSVRVPVLSRHTTSTRARPSTAGSCWTRTRRRASVTAATPKATLVSRTRPCGTMPTSAATVPVAACRARLMGVQRADDQQHGHRRDRPGDVAQDLVDAVHQLRAHQREPPRLGGELAGVRVGAHRRWPGSRPTRRPRSCPTAAGHRPACPPARTRRSAATHRPPGSCWRAPPRPRPAGRRRAGRPGHRRRGPPTAMSCGAPSRITRTRGALSTASRSSVRLARSSCAMPISALVTSTMPNRASCGWPDDQDHGQQDTEDEVEPGQDVRPQDLGDRAAGALPARVRQPARAPLGNLGAGQARRRRLRDRRGRRRWREAAASAMPGHRAAVKDQRNARPGPGRVPATSTAAGPGHGWSSKRAR